MIQSEFKQQSSAIETDLARFNSKVKELERLVSKSENNQKNYSWIFEAREQSGYFIQKIHKEK